MVIKMKQNVSTHHLGMPLYFFALFCFFFCLKAFPSSSGHAVVLSIIGRLRVNVSKYRPGMGKMNFLKNPKKSSVDYPRYSSDENINFSFIG